MQLPYRLKHLWSKTRAKVTNRCISSRSPLVTSYRNLQKLPYPDADMPPTVTPQHAPGLDELALRAYRVAPQQQRCQNQEYNQSFHSASRSVSVSSR